MFPHNTNLVVSGGQFTQVIQHRNSGIKRLGRASAPSAIHNYGGRSGPPKCHPLANTRVAVLDQIMHWILSQENSEALIMWLFGPAGSGKSAIAQTLAEQCSVLKILLASFFFSRSDPSRNHARSFIATIAYQVVINFPDSRDIITRVPEQDPLVLTQSFEAQLSSLVIGPLEQLYLAGKCTGSPNPYLIIIDGLDECADPQVQVSILSSISKALQQCPFPLKFLIASRPELHLATEFNSGTTNSMLSRLPLDNKFVSDNDDTVMLPLSPLCFPFSGSKPKCRLSWSASESRSFLPDSSKGQKMVRHPSSPPAPSLTFHSDSERYDEIPFILPAHPKDQKSPLLLLGRVNMTNDTKKSTSFLKWGYGRGAGKKEKVSSADEKSSSQVNPPLLYHPVMRRNFKSTQSTPSTQRTTAPRPRPSLIGHVLYPQETFVDSALERKIDHIESIRLRPDNTDRLDKIRCLMAKDNLDYYVVPSEDSHGSEYVAASDRRREFISGFTGWCGQAIITANAAYLFTDPRYWIQAQEEIDHNWTLVRCGSPGAPQDWIEWLVARVRGSRIGLDCRMISHEKATFIKTKIQSIESKLVFPPKNLVDLIWAERPEKSNAKVYIYSTEFAGESADSKLERLREWIKQQPPSIPSESKRQTRRPLVSQVHVATLVTSLPCIAYLLNLRGSDIPYNPLFHAYLFVSLYETVLFVDSVKLDDDAVGYLDSIEVKRRNYADLWPFLREREWGEGKVLVDPQTSYAISLMLTHFRYTIAPSYIEYMMSIKNEIMIEGLRRAYLRDGASFVRFLAWLEHKLVDGYNFTEYEAGLKLTEFRRKNKHFMGLARENISASGPNTALPHYTPKKSSASFISRKLPYLNSSGAQYFDGTCDTSRTVHFGHPNSSEMCEAYTNVLRAHIAIDSAIFPGGTSRQQLDLLAHKSLWRDGLKDLHGFGSFSTKLHGGPHSFTSSIPLVPGHLVTNEQGFYLEGKWGLRIESTLVVKRVKAKSDFQGDISLGFERFTLVPIQTKMVEQSMLTKVEKQWLKDHNQHCYETLSPFLQHDNRALKWLKRAAGIPIDLGSYSQSSNVQGKSKPSTLNRSVRLEAKGKRIDHAKPDMIERSESTPVHYMGQRPKNEKRQLTHSVKKDFKSDSETKEVAAIPQIKQDLTTMRRIQPDCGKDAMRS